MFRLAWLFQKEENKKEALYYKAEDKEIAWLQWEIQEGEKPKTRKKRDRYKKREWELGEEAKELLLSYIAKTYDITTEEATGLLGLYLLEVANKGGNKWKYRILSGLQTESLRHAIQTHINAFLWEATWELRKKNTKENLVKMFELIDRHMEKRRRGEGVYGLLLYGREREKATQRRTAKTQTFGRNAVYFYTCGEVWQTQGYIWNLLGTLSNFAKAQKQP